MGENVAYLETDVGLTTYTCSDFAGFSRFVILRERERDVGLYSTISRGDKNGVSEDEVTVTSGLHARRKNKENRK